MSALDDFKKGAKTVGGQSKDGDVWSPGFDDQKMPRFEPDEKVDYRIGYYLGSKAITVRGHDKPSTVHMFQYPSGEKFQLWGTTVLDDKLEEAVRVYGVGRLTAVVWKGREPMKNIKEDYLALKKSNPASLNIRFPWNTSTWMNWEVSVNTEAEPLKIVGEDQVFQKSTTNAAPQAPVAPPAAPAATASLPSELPAAVDGAFSDTGEDPY